MASYIHGTGAEKLAPSEREERLQRKRRQDVGRSVKRQHRIRRKIRPHILLVPCMYRERICMTAREIFSRSGV